MKIKYLSIILLFLGVSFIACKTSKQVVTTGPKPTPTIPLSINGILEKLEANQIKANWLDGDADMSVESKVMNVSASMTFRFKKDSIIWFNVKKLGFNVARAKVTPDSVYVINYLQGNYMAESLDAIEKKFNIPANFTIIQNIILGNPVFLTDKTQLKMEKDPSGNIILRGSNTEWNTQYTIDPLTTSIKEMSFEQAKAQRVLNIAFDNYVILKGYENNDKMFPYLRTLKLDSPQTGKSAITIEVDADGLEVNKPKVIKFEIPSHYEKMN